MGGERKRGATGGAQRQKSPVLTVQVVPVSTLSVGEDSQKSFQHRGEGAAQQGPEGGGQGPARGSQGPLGGRDDRPHRLAEVAGPQDDGRHVQLQFDTAAVDLWVSAAQRHQGCLCAKCFDVSTTIAWKERRINSQLFPLPLVLWSDYTA